MPARCPSTRSGNFDVSGDTLTASEKGRGAVLVRLQQYLMGYLPVVMLTLNAKYGVLPINNIYTGPNASHDGGCRKRSWN